MCEGGQVKISAPELPCYVVLALANGGRSLDHEGNVVLVACGAVHDTHGGAK